MKLIDLPKIIQPEKYEALKSKLVAHLSLFPSIQSIYQLGSIQDPGISDLDLLCVFKDGADLSDIHLPQLSAEEQYILTHPLFGIRETELEAAIDLNFYTNYSLLYGKNLRIREQNELPHELKGQIALEFLLMFYFSLYKQNYLHIYKLRAFLLEAKALSFDLALLGQTNGDLFDLIKEVTTIRKEYFQRKLSLAYLSDFIHSFLFALEKELQKLLQEQAFYLPKERLNISKNMSILKHQDFFVRVSGITLKNSWFSGPTAFKIKNRLTRFNFCLPYELPEKNSIIDKRFRLFSQIHQSNREDYPNFIPLSSKLKFY